MSAALVRSLPASERSIAGALGSHSKEIEPNRYDADGSRKPQGFRALQCNVRTAMVNGNLPQAVRTSWAALSTRADRG